ncbi:hypothetical protein KIH74_11200 [Kineosporia sp. J2-2]|uniref:Lipoprotein n=1 Tax=Kineosporia corallincola TaxID=2835133 RepID=A0ABS5TEH3_9ACTN|nr:hypothetical protein [Kineosporia corallincola]MBT0769490.1 hypothetical protein [Kineosporia corallincola]
MTSKRSVMMRSLLVGPGVTVLLAACGGGSDEAAAPEATSVPAATGEASASATPSASATTDPARIAKVKAQAEKTIQQYRDAGYTAQADQQQAALKALLDGTAPDDTEKIGGIACTLVEGTLSQVEGLDADDAQEVFSATLDYAVKGSSNDLNQTFDGVDLDGRMSDTCADVHTKALKATGLKSLNDLPQYF